MHYFNNSGYDVYLLGNIIKNNMIFTIETDELSRIEKETNEIIHLKDAFLILNKSFCNISPKIENDDHLKIIQSPFLYESVTFFNFKGEGLIIVDNTTFTINDFNKMYNNIFISKNKIIIMDSKISYEVGIK